MRRVGHKGADALAPGNTEASFRAAVEHGVDMIEFDVLPLRDGRIVLAHDYVDARERNPLTLDEGLDLLAGADFAHVELDVDLKLPGAEEEVARGLAERGLVARSLCSCQHLEALDLLRTIEPAIRRGWSVPKVRRDYTRTPLAVPAYGVARILRARLPAQAARAVRSGRIHAVMTHQLLWSPRLVRAVHAAGGEVYVWTVDVAARIERLVAGGVDGVITNDPRLFAAPGGLAELAEAG